MAGKNTAVAPAAPATLPQTTSNESVQTNNSGNVSLDTVHDKTVEQEDDEDDEDEDDEDEDDEEEDEEEEEKQDKLDETTPQTNKTSRIIVDPYDSHATHVTMDECISDFFNTNPGLSENQTNSNITLVILSISVILTLALHICEKIYGLSPLNQYTIPALIAFFGAQGVLTAMSYFGGGELFYSYPFFPPNLDKQQEEGESNSNTQKQIDGELYTLAVYTSSALYTVEHTVGLELQSVKDSTKSFAVEKVYDVQDYFNVAGLFLQKKFEKSLQSLLDELLDEYKIHENKKNK